MNEKTYCYVVNTFTIQDFEPVQLSGEVVACSEVDAINKLIADGIVYAKGYEFLMLKIKD